MTSPFIAALTFTGTISKSLAAAIQNISRDPIKLLASGENFALIGLVAEGPASELRNQMIQACTGFKEILVFQPGDWSTLPGTTSHGWLSRKLGSPGKHL